jgi:hypothetical protein
MQKDRDKNPRRPSREHDERTSVKLTRKFAEMIDGVNLSDAHVGDRLELSEHDAEVLIAEGWAERAPRRTHTHKHPLALAADKPRRRKKSARR